MNQKDEIEKVQEQEAKVTKKGVEKDRYFFDGFTLEVTILDGRNGQKIGYKKHVTDVEWTKLKKGLERFVLRTEFTQLVNAVIDLFLGEDGE